MLKILIFFICLSALAAEKDLLRISDNEIILGVKANLGGRVMLFRRHDGQNVINSNPKHWGLTDKQIPAANCKSKFVEYNGHIVWVGPYSKWWSDPEPKLTPPDSGFYPDQYLIYDRCKVLEHSAKKLVLLGNQSPLNGMQMQKSFEIIGGGKVKLTVKVTNRRKRPVTWNIWSNTRFNPEGQFGFPVAWNKNLLFSFSAWRPYKERALSFDIDKGICAFNRPDPKLVKKYSYYGKLSYKKYCPIYAVLGNNLFIKQVSGTPKGSVPSEHAPVEVYQRFTSDSRGNIMELEFHSPLFTLQPGESYTFAETWTLKKLAPEIAEKALSDIVKSK